MEGEAISAQPLLNIGTLLRAHTGTDFRIEGRASAVFRRSDATINKIVLTQLTNNPHAPAGEIELFPLGRWSAALSQLQRDQVVRVERPAVQYSDNPTVNTLQLDLEDSPGHALFPRDAPAIHLLNERMEVTFSLTHEGLGDRSQRLPSPPPRPTRSVNSTARGSRRRRSSSQWDSCIEYKTIGEILENGMELIGHKVNVYGVVVDARAAFPTRGKDLKWEIHLADEHSLEGDGTLNTLSVFCFESYAEQGIPFCGVGDIVRIHRLCVAKYTDYDTNRVILNAKAPFYATIVLWPAHSASREPSVTRPPFNPRAPQVVDSTHQSVFEAEDYDRLRDLRGWVRNTLLPRVDIKKLSVPVSVRDILNLPSGGVRPFAMVDVLCRIEAELPAAEGSICFVASDGTSHIRLRFESQVSHLHQERAPHLSYADCNPSWQLRPPLPAWAVLRDVSFVPRGGEIVGVLSMERRTSTIVFRPDSARDVCDMVGRANTPGCAPVNLLLPGWEPLPQTVPLQRSVLSSQSQQSAAAVSQSQHGSQTATACVVERVTPERVRQLKPHPSPPRQALENGGPATTPLARVRQATSIEETPPAKRPRRADNEMYQPLQALRDGRVITKHGEMHRPISKLSELRVGVDTVRVRVRARGVASPSAVWAMCQPWCNDCRRFLSSEVLADGEFCRMRCDGCGGSRDDDGAGVRWAYSVRLLVEDDDGVQADVWLEGAEGARFFHDAPATDLWSDGEARRKVRRLVGEVAAGANRLDCLLKSFEWEDDDGMGQFGWQMFGTQLAARVENGR